MFNVEDKAAIELAARKNGIEPRALLALGLTESGGRVKWTVHNKELPAIRPEVHVFYRELKDHPEQQRLAVERGLAHPKRLGIKLPRSYSAIYSFYNRMAEINEEAAAASTSWGWGQVMGFNYKLLGYDAPTDVSNAAMAGVTGQTHLVCRYLEKTGLSPFLNDLPSLSSAERVAKGYNGPKWKENDYANKLIRNWKIAGADATQAAGRSTAELQTALTRLGYDPGGIDGQTGAATKAALRSYQVDNGLVADGDAGTLTWEALNEDLAELRSKGKQKTKDSVGAVGVGGATIAVATEVLGEAQGLKDSVMGFFSDLSIPVEVIQLAALGAVAYFVYWRYFRK
jgi:hypothetical protein